MGILRLIEALAFILGAAAIVTQVIVPLFKGTALFPIFNKDRRDLISEITESLTEAEVEELRREYAALREQETPVEAQDESETKTKESISE